MNSLVSGCSIVIENPFKPMKCSDCGGNILHDHEAWEIFPDIYEINAICYYCSSCDFEITIGARKPYLLSEKGRAGEIINEIFDLPLN